MTETERPPFPLGDALEQVISEYEDHDCILFDPVQLPSNVGRSQSPFDARRRTPGEKRFSIQAHSNHSKPLPGLASEDDLRAIRQEISLLERQKSDNCMQIEMLERDINKFNNQLAALSAPNVSVFPVTPPKYGASGASARATAKRVRPLQKPVDEIALEYQRKFEKLSKDYEKLKDSLMKKGKLTRGSVNGLKPSDPTI